MIPARGTGMIYETLRNLYGARRATRISRSKDRFALMPGEGLG